MIILYHDVRYFNINSSNFLQSFVNKNPPAHHSATAHSPPGVVLTTSYFWRFVLGKERGLLGFCTAIGGRVYREWRTGRTAILDKASLGVVNLIAI